MAQHEGYNLKEISSDDKRDPFSEIQLSSTRTRTLKRTLSDEFSHGINNGGPTKSRRVDPERLACRLHPDLVRDMEVLIAQGTRMPPFEIRKELQERFQVDRRHIYDYFHSRGMRVAKEDKHRNLSRRRAMLNKPKVPQSASDASSLVTTPAAPPATRLAAAFEHKAKPYGGKTQCAPLPRSSKPRKQKRTPKFSMPIVDSPPPAPASPASGPMFCPDFNANSEDSDSTTQLQEPITTLQDTPVDWALSTDKSESFDEEDWNRLTVAYLEDSASFSSISAMHEFEDAVYDPTPVDTLQSPRSERLAIYDLINNNIGHDSNTAEHIGTYKSFMEKQSRLYYSRFFVGPRKLPKSLPDPEQIPIASNTFSADSVTGTTSGNVSSQSTDLLRDFPSIEELLPPAIDQQFDSFFSLSPTRSFQLPFPVQSSDEEAVNCDSDASDFLRLMSSALLPDQMGSLSSANAGSPGGSSQEQVLSSAPQNSSSEHMQAKPITALPFPSYMRPNLQSTSRNVISRDGLYVNESLVSAFPTFLDHPRAARILSTDMRPSRHRTASAGGGL